MGWLALRRRIGETVYLYGPDGRSLGAVKVCRVRGPQTVDLGFHLDPSIRVERAERLERQLDRLAGQATEGGHDDQAA